MEKIVLCMNFEPKETGANNSEEFEDSVRQTDNGRLLHWTIRYNKVKFVCYRVNQEIHVWRLW